MRSSTSAASTALFTIHSSYIIFICAIIFSLFALTNAATSDQWRSRSIYQIITDRFARTDGSTTEACDLADLKYCGGTWQGIINKLDYIQGMGFTAIWISPIITNIEGNDEVGQPYHGFWSKDITTLNSNFGTADDLNALAKAVHDRDMYLMIDVVANNLAYAGPGGSVDFTQFTPFNKEEYFHKFCYISDYNDMTDYQDCWLGSEVLSLPDLDTESEFVMNTWNQWAKDTISNYSVDGFRIDAAKHVDTPFWSQFQQEANVYTLGEVLTGNQSSACRWANNALDGVLNYPMWYAINNTFLNQPPESMKSLWGTYTGISAACQDTTILGTFNENQDQPRLANYTSDVSLLKNALAFTLLSDGVPIIYYGSEQQFAGQKDPENREALWLTGYDTSMPLYGALAAMNAARNAVAQLSTYTYWSSYWTWKSKIVMWKDEVLVIRKGYDHSIVTIMTNRGQDSDKLGPYQIKDTNFNEGEKIMDVLGCTSQTAGAFGTFTTTIEGGEPQVWVPTYMMVNATDICPKISKTTALMSMVNSQGTTPEPSYIAITTLVLGCLLLVLR